MEGSKTREIIELFERVQAVPYYLLKHRDSRKLFDLNKGCCAEKIIWLGNELKELGIQVEYYLLEFLWEELLIPKEILKLKKPGPGHHLAMKARIDDKWLWVDPTWDPGLKRAGFPATKDWDGQSDTLLAVRPQKIEEFEPEDPSDTDLRQEFIDKLNEYLERIRKKAKINGQL